MITFVEDLIVLEAAEDAQLERYRPPKFVNRWRDLYNTGWLIEMENLGEVSNEEYIKLLEN